MNDIISIVIDPPKNVCDFTAEFKQVLGSKTGFFGSLNSKAHITIATFKSDDVLIALMKTHIRKFCDKQFRFPVKLDKPDFFGTRTLYLAPDPLSSGLIKTMSKKLLWKDHLKLFPHLTIARNLNPYQYKIAREMFYDKNINLEFICEGVVIRKLDTLKKQYEIIDTINFGGPILNSPDNKFSDGL